ncbi:MAG: beta-lactamase family protein [Cyclobacteriaceae bacterium]|nr:beta-lactamase family protein [Cyclobacteriaceae bacterium]
MKHLITIFLIALAISATAQTKSIQKSAPLVPATPESVGMSSERLSRIETMCKDAVQSDLLPGMVVLVARKGKIVLHEAYGHADHAVGEPLKKDAIFRIASQTKAITSTAVMMLWEEGRFHLDDPISKYIPEFKNPQVLKSFHYADTSYTTVAANKEITIRHLLTHTSGIGYGDIDGDERMKMIHQKAGIISAFTTESVSLDEMVKKLARLPLHHPPGEKYTYSLGLDVLGYFVEIVSGMPFDEFLRKRIFNPLGMDDTWFYLPKSKADRLVSVQRKTNGKWEKLPATFYDPEYPVTGARTYFSGGGGLSSTAKDYAVFLQMYLNGGEYNGIRLLSRTTVQAIMANQTGDLFYGGTDSYYGLAFGVTTPHGQGLGGKGSTGTFEWGGYFNTQYFADPQEQVIGIIMKQTQGVAGDPSGWKFKQLVGQAIDD